MTKDPYATEFLQIRIRPDRKTHYKKAAQKAGKKLAAWMQEHLDAVSKFEQNEIQN